MAMSAQSSAPDTADRILDVAELMLQTRGYNAMSYGAIAGEVGVTKAALHYHFPTKADLGLAVLQRYRDGFSDALEGIDARKLPAMERLAAYAQLYVDVLVGDRLCLCAMLAAEQRTLDDAIRHEVDHFFGANHAWLASVVETGRADGTIAGVGEPDALAEMVLGTLEGAMLMAWARRDVGLFRRAAERLFATLAPAR
jgi:TetR/AcrR family transcriptional repressor of nem operon